MYYTLRNHFFFVFFRGTLRFFYNFLGIFIFTIPKIASNHMLPNLSLQSMCPE